MPLWTFVCDEGHEQEILCKPLERDQYAGAPCPLPGCSGNVQWQGAERVAERDFAKGAYRMKLIMGDGSTKPVNNVYTDRKRSDS